jgi:hypothetical protein
VVIIYDFVIETILFISKLRDPFPEIVPAKKC